MLQFHSKHIRLWRAQLWGEGGRKGGRLRNRWDMTRLVWIRVSLPFFSSPSLLSTFSIASIFWHLHLIESVASPSGLLYKRMLATWKGASRWQPTSLPHHLEGNEMSFSHSQKSYIQFGGSSTFQRLPIPFHIETAYVLSTTQYKMRERGSAQAQRDRGQGWIPHLTTFPGVKPGQFVQPQNKDGSSRSASQSTLT